jgi:hypothetical protein
VESYLTKCPDVPIETILTQHLMSLGHWLSDAALDATVCAGEVVSIVFLRSRADVRV